ncbi:MAG TPA: Asp23/Gls24 family envelope stress response protein [Ktedonobacterales bacterium]|jgi:uncharacterized alkaline shock family protein YloU
MTTARDGMPDSQAGAEPEVAPPPPVDDYSPENLGSVRIARRVLRTVIEEAALGVPGVARLAMNVSQWPHLIGRSLPIHGVALVVRDDVVSVDLYLIAQPDVNLIEIGVAVQEAVGQAVDHILGMRASEINVYVQDVA